LAKRKDAAETHIERHLESSPSELATSSAENITNCTNNVEWENSAKIQKAEAQQAFDQMGELSTMI